MKKIVILGATGGIGKYLIDYIKKVDTEHQFELIGVGRHSNEYVEKNTTFISVDISKRDDFQKLPKDVYAVIDLAGAMPARMEGYTPELYLNTNIMGTFNVLQYCIENKVDRILYTQSFGDIKDRAEEELVLTPDMTPKFEYTSDHSVYVVSKNTAVELIKCYNAEYHLKAFIFRLPTVYSWSHNDSYYVDGVLRKRAWRLLIEKATKGEDIEVWGDASRPKDMVYVKDFCQMLYLACLVNQEFGYYNVGTGIGTTLLDQVKGMIEVFGEDKKSNIIMRPDKPNAPQYIMDIENAKKELGYKPQYSYIDMLKDMKVERDLSRF